MYWSEAAVPSSALFGVVVSTAAGTLAAGVSVSEGKAYLGLLTTGLSGAGEAGIRLCNLPDQLWFY